MGKTYISPSGIANELKKVYFGDSNNLAKSVNKIYIGDQNGIARIVFGNTLPTGYTPIEYIQSDGTSWINTEYCPTGNTHVKIICSDFPPGAVNACIFGTRIASKNNSFTFLYSTTATVYRYNYGNTEKAFSIPSTTAIQEIDANKESVTIKVNGNTYTDTHSAQTISTTYPIYLFALNNAGTATYPVSAKIYSCRIWENNTLVRDFIPCENPDGIQGLYDLCNNIFYGLPQKLWLIKDGQNLCGLYRYSYAGSSADNKITEMSSLIELETEGSSNTAGRLRCVTNNKINASSYSKVSIEFKCRYLYPSTSQMQIWMGYNTSKNPTTSSAVDLLVANGAVSSFPQKTYTYNISITNEVYFYIILGNNTYNTGYSSAYLYNFWLER